MKHCFIFVGLCLLSVSYAQNRSDTIHVAHYDIHLSIVDLSQQTIDGYTDLKIVPRMIPLSYCDLDIASSLTVDSVFHGNQTVTFSHSGSRLRIAFDNAVSTQDTQRIRVYYQGKPATDPFWGGFYFTETMAYNMGVGMNMIPPVFGRCWFPCIDEFSDKSTYTFCIRTDFDKMAVCGGMLTDSSTFEDQTNYWKWELNTPIPTYLASVAVGDFQCYQDTFHGINGMIPIEIYATSSYIGNVPGSFVNLKTVLRDFEARLGPYYWQRVGYVAVPFGGGAMEHAANIAYPQTAIAGNTQNEYLAFHELSHAWFGNLLTCGNANNMWINEGFATYAETMAEEALDPTLTRYKTSVRTLHRSVLTSAHRDDGGYYALDSVPQNRTYGTTSYDKGGLVAHTLRHYLGDSLFFSGLRTLFQENAYGNVNSDQFFDKMSQITGVDLTDFYLGWVHQPGFLHFSIDSVVKNGQTDSQYYLYFKQKLHHARYFANSNRIDVEFVSSVGERCVLRHISFSGEEACVEVTLPFMPAFWIIDPDEKMGDAVIKYPITVSNTNTINCDDAYFGLIPETHTANSQLRVEYHLVAPDPLKTPNPNMYKLSDTHYWCIEFYENNITNGNFQFRFNAQPNQPDYNLFRGYNRDSLILLYRRNPTQDWQIHPSTLTGSIYTGQLTTRLLFSGEYTLAMGRNTVSTYSFDSDDTFSVYPNPVTSHLHIELAASETADYTIYNIMGQTVMQGKLQESAVINMESLAKGMYYLRIGNKVAKIINQ